MTAVARCSTDLSGLLGIDGASPELGNIQLVIKVVTPNGSEKTDPLFAAWKERCPIYLALLKPNAVAVSMRAGEAAREPTN